jgi:hypothetical protein
VAIPKHLKKQLKQDFRRSPEKKVGRSRTWSYAVGDLVKLKKEDSWGLIIGKIGSYYSVMTPTGQRNIYPSSLERVQPLAAVKTDKKDT